MLRLRDRERVEQKKDRYARAIFGTETATQDRSSVPSRTAVGSVERLRLYSADNEEDSRRRSRTPIFTEKHPAAENRVVPSGCVSEDGEDRPHESLAKRYQREATKLVPRREDPEAKVKASLRLFRPGIGNVAALLTTKTGEASLKSNSVSFQQQKQLRKPQGELGRLDELLCNFCASVTGRWFSWFRQAVPSSYGEKEHWEYQQQQQEQPSPPDKIPTLALRIVKEVLLDRVRLAFASIQSAATDSLIGDRTRSLGATLLLCVIRRLVACRFRQVNSAVPIPPSPNGKGRSGICRSVIGIIREGMRRSFAGLRAAAPRNAGRVDNAAGVDVQTHKEAERIANPAGCVRAAYLLLGSLSKILHRRFRPLLSARAELSRTALHNLVNVMKNVVGTRLMQQFEMVKVACSEVRKGSAVLMKAETIAKARRRRTIGTSFRRWKVRYEARGKCRNSVLAGAKCMSFILSKLKARVFRVMAKWCRQDAMKADSLRSRAQRFAGIIQRLVREDRRLGRAFGIWRKFRDRRVASIFKQLAERLKM